MAGLSVKCQCVSSCQRQRLKCFNRPLMKTAQGKNDLRGVRRKAIQMSALIDKMLVVKFPKIEMLQRVGVLIKFGIAFKCEYYIAHIP